MKPSVNKTQQEYSVGCRRHRFHRDEVDVIHGRQRVITARGEVYYRVKSTSHGLQKKSDHIDSDMGRVRLDSCSSDFRGFDTTEF